MQCPECGESMVKPSKEEVMEMLERKKKQVRGSNRPHKHGDGKAKKKISQKRSPKEFERLDYKVFNTSFFYTFSWLLLDA